MAEERETWELRRRQVSTCPRRQHYLGPPAEGKIIWTAIPELSKPLVEGGAEEEQKHLHLQKQILQKARLMEEVLAESCEHDEAKEPQIQRQQAQSAARKLTWEALCHPELTRNSEWSPKDLPVC